VLMLTAIGNAAGSNWKHWKHYFSYLDYVAIAAIVLGIAYLVLKRRNRTAETEPV
jgi:membrane protein DedA with SNARE-associated domain